MLKAPVVPEKQLENAAEVSTRTEQDAARSLVSKLRQQIDETDDEIIRLVRVRTDLGKQVDVVRKAIGEPRFAYNREFEVLARYRSLGVGGTNLAMQLLRFGRDRL